MTCATLLTPARRRAMARWLAVLVLCVAWGPVVSGALAARHAEVASAACAVHAGHGMPCPGGSADATSPGTAGHCPLCLLSAHPPVLGEPPRLAGAFVALHGAARAPSPRAVPHDRAQRWLQQRQHAPPTAA